MIGLKNNTYKSRFVNDDSCLEWLKKQIYPYGIKCPVCKKVTKHHKISKRHCYACDNCRHQVYPTAGTIFHKSTVPLKIWFDIIRRIADSRGPLSASDIQKEYGISYKTAHRMIEKIEKVLQENQSADHPPVIYSDFNRAIQLLAKTTGIKKLNKEKRFKARRSSDSISFPLNNNQADNKTHENQRKKDRTARLLKLQILLWQNPQGLTIEDLASRCSISKRTIYRDLRALESELEVPIWEDKDKRGIVEGYYLPPIRFALSEANNIFVAARLMQQFSPAYDSNIISTLMKLNTIVPPPLRKQICNTLDFMERQPRDSRIVYNFNKLVQAWLSQHKVRITYQNLVDEEDPVERIIEPYFIEPSMIGSTSYVIAYCHHKKTICAFAISYIIGNVIIEPDTFEIPEDFNAIDYLNTAWGIYSENKGIETVKLLFKPKISTSILNIRLHSSQKTEVQRDGSVIMTLKVRDTIQFFGWILAWRDKVEVLEPESLRNEICVVAKSLLNKYQSGH